MKYRKLYFTLLLSCSLLTLTGCGKKEKDITASLSPRALAAKNYIDNELPSAQRQAFYTGNGDKANLYANLINSGHLEGAAEYAEVLLKISDEK
ncbi:MAG: hypothetical protein J6X49_12855 [Victivallales bacterium]|nr:hypothetical protein [Victivallales bacterium]